MSLGRVGDDVKVLVACEQSGRVRDAFVQLGHDAWSCDLLPSETAGNHIQGDVLEILEDGWDLMIAHPPRTYLCSSGLHWNTKRPERAKLTHEAMLFVFNLIDAPIPKIAIENPVGCISTNYRKPDQIIQPWQFGENASKATCLWLKGLSKLDSEAIVEPRLINGKRIWGNQTPSGQNKLGPSPTRAAERSRTYSGIAKAFARQWGSSH